MRAIFFDLDGTLVDTERTAVAVTREWLASRGHRERAPWEEAIVGRTWSLAAEMLCERLALNLSPAELERELVAAYRERTAAGVTPLPGAREFVRLASQRYRCFVVSGSPRRDIEHALRSLDVRDCIERYYGAEDYPRSKPAPDGYRKALEEAALSPDDVVVFEDSEAGIASAEAAGLPLVVVTGAAAVPPPNAGAHPAVADFRGLGIEWLESRFRRAGA